MGSKKVKRPNILHEAQYYMPTVEECEKCEYQDQCDGGRLCVGKKDKKREEKKF